MTPSQISDSRSDAMKSTEVLPRKSVLMVSYAYPPVGFFMGSLRLVKFAKYLPEFGWDPIVLSAGDGYCHGSGPQNFELPPVTVVRSSDLLGVLARVTGIASAKNANDAQIVRSQSTPDATSQVRNAPTAGVTGADRVKLALRKAMLSTKKACFAFLKEILIPDYNITWYPFPSRKVARRCAARRWM